MTKTEKSNIEWTDYTFNPWIGCTKVSPECAHCYAERDDERFGWTPRGWGKGQPRHRTSKANWAKPLSWDRLAEKRGVRFRVFTASLADIFDKEVPDSWRDDLFALISFCRNLDWLILTKRPGKMKSYMEKLSKRHTATVWSLLWTHVWLGVSIGDQKTADKRIPILLQIPAARRFVSYEPAIKWADLRNWMQGKPRLDWVIVGGESGEKARPFNMEWARKTVRHCQDRDVPVFVKQLGEAVEGWCVAGLHDPEYFKDPYCDLHEGLDTTSTCGRRCVYLKHKKGADPSEWPPEIRVREFPEST